MRRIKGLKIYVPLSLLMLLGLIIGPNFKYLSPGNWWGQTLVVLMNENEARPCGGFVTAYGVVNLPFGGMELNNSFAFPNVDLGLNEEPLRQVSREKKFWDLGTSVDPNRCGQDFVSAYERATGNYPDRVFLIQSQLLEAYLAALGPVKAGDLTLEADTFFALTSRLVADIDRHDETALAERKNPLHLFGKRVIVSTLMRPWKWFRLSRTVFEAEQNGALYLHVPGHERPLPWLENPDRSMILSEWNLGGGKSSRYLDKQWTVFFRQQTPDRWEVEHRIMVTHIGQEDRPLSQAWRGGFELRFFDKASRFVPAEIAPGQTFTHTEVYHISHDTLFNFLSTLEPTQAQFTLFSPPFQQWQQRVQISALGQQTVQPTTSNLRAQEGSAVWSGLTDLQGESFGFSLTADELPPFLTWHKPLLEPSETITATMGLAEGDIVVELHFNEPVNLGDTPFELLEDGAQRFNGQDLSIVLKDRDFEVSEVTADMAIISALLLPDQTTFLLRVRPEPYQLNERYYLELSGVQDRWGNTQTITNRTVITR